MITSRIVSFLHFQALDQYYYENNLKIFQGPGAPPPEATPGKIYDAYDIIDIVKYVLVLYQLGN